MIVSVVLGEKVLLFIWPHSFFWSMHELAVCAEIEITHIFQVDVRIRHQLNLLLQCHFFILLELLRYFKQLWIY